MRPKKRDSRRKVLQNVTGVWVTAARHVSDSSHKQGSKRLAKVRLSILKDLFLICWPIQSLIFWGSGFLGHFRTARSGVYIGLCCMFDYGIRGCRNEINS